MTHFRGGGSRTPYSHHVEFVRDDESVRRRGRRTSSVRTPNFRNSGGGRSIDGNRYLQTRISASDVLLPTFFENSKSRRGVMDLRSFTPRETRVQRRTVDAYIDLSLSLSLPPTQAAVFNLAHFASKLRPRSDMQYSRLTPSTPATCLSPTRF